jgi:hypothetical protein
MLAVWLLLPFPTPGGDSGSIFGWHSHCFTSVRESQLRGSGGISPRFPNIPLRDKVDEDDELRSAGRRMSEIQV